MKAQLLVFAAGVFGALSVGWFTAVAPEPRTGAPVSVPEIVHGGVDAGAARTLLVELGLVAPPELIQEPPPPDIAVLFRRDLTAVEARASDKLVWVVDHTQAFQRRALRVGDIYQDGWRVSRIDVQSIELRRRREVRSVDAFALAPSGP